MATQFSVIRGDYFPAQILNLSSATDDFSNLSCTGEIRPYPDGPLLYQFVPTISYAERYSGSLYFDIPSSVTRSFPPINLYGDLHFYSTGINDITLFEFRINVLEDVTHM